MEKIYETGYVYYCYHNDVVKYVGSTVNFPKRIKKHKDTCYNLNNAKSNYPLYQYIRDTDAWDNFEFKIEYTYHNITRKELEKHEAKYILEFELENLLNCCVPGRTGKEYRRHNKEIIKIKDKQKYLKNFDKIKIQKQIKYQQNKEEVKARAKKWKNDNPEKIKARALKTWYCDVCDNTIKLYCKSSHKKSKTHQSNLYYSNLFHLDPNIFN